MQDDRLPTSDGPATVPALLAAAVDRHGSGDYIVTAENRMTFAEADEWSRVFAQRLVDAGVGKGTRVGLSLPSGIDWVVAFLATARIGAISVLLSTTYRPWELQRALRIGDVDTLIAPTSLFGRDQTATLTEAVDGLADSDGAPLHLPAMPYLRRILLVGEDAPDWAEPVTLGGQRDAAVDEALLRAIEQEVAPADDLLVIFTSGSSADPKGVIHTHGVAVRKVGPEVGLGLQASTRNIVFMAMPFFWVGGPQSVLGCLHSGSTLLCQERFDAESGLELIERERATSIGGWATTIDALREHPDYERRDTSSLPDFAALRPGSLNSSRGHPINMGMTETFGPHANPRWFDYLVIDRETGEALPDGDEGEFCVRGFGLMRGFVKREREEVFDVDGYYHTGDRGYIEDGRIFFTGRDSEMVKARGANVAPLEVELALRTLDDVDTAHVLGVQSPGYGEEVVAFVVPVAGSDLDVTDVRTRLRHLLSAYKVPTQWVVLEGEQVPLLGNGKPDKRSMRARYEAGDLVAISTR